MQFQISFVGQEKKTIRENQTYLSTAFNSDHNSGYMFSFTLTVTQVVLDKGTFAHQLHSNFGVALRSFDSTKWNLDKITLYIGGYKRSNNSGQNFEGCLSDFMFQGVNIINTYFQQYPNNTNPVKGSVTIGNFSNKAQTCDDVMSTVAPTSINPTTVGSGVAGFEVYSFLLFFTFSFMIFVL